MLSCLADDTNITFGEENTCICVFNVVNIKCNDKSFDRIGGDFNSLDASADMGFIDNLHKARNTRKASLTYKSSRLMTLACSRVVTLSDDC